MVVQHVAGQLKVRLHRSGFAGANHLDRNSRTLQAGNNRIFQLPGDALAVARRGLIAELNPNRQLGAHCMGRRGRHQRIAHRIQVAGLVLAGFLQVGPAYLRARTARLGQIMFRLFNKIGA